MSIIRESAMLGDQEFIIETGRMALQANGSVVVQYGKTQVLCTAVAGKIIDLPYFPLTVNYQENMWASGTIPGNYFRREGRPSDKATLTSRLIDRPVRPLFADGYENETQVIAWVLSADKVNDPDVLGITAASAALIISDIPWEGPLVGVRVGRIDGEFIANPTFEQREKSEMDIVVAVTDEAIAMVEGEADEVELSIMLDALEFAREAAKPLLKLQHEMAEKLGKEKMKVSPKTANADIAAAVDKAARKKLTKAVTIKDKLERYAAVDALKAEMVEKLAEKFIVQDEDTTAKEARKKAEGEVKEAFESLKKKIVRGLVAKDKKRIDGRRPDEIRNISIEVGLIPSAHGSALFTRGETQALVTATLGSDRDAQRVEHLEGRQEERRFMLHYNFPPFCVGEVNFRMGTGRREKGHGMLAERALVPVVPDLENTFPYTIRVVSDIMGSNGSSSMASVCGGSLAMMDAGIPVTRPTAGIAMGLIKEGDDLTVLSDILGDEDHLGDMDFKVCGTSKGITAFQLDTKIAGITKETMTAALTQARDGIDHILGEMAKVLDTPRAELSENAPRITTVKIPGDTIGLVIGQGGKTIKSIQDATNTTIKIEEEGGMGVVSISSSDKTSTQQVIEIIEGLTAEPEVGKVYLGTVKKIVDFGAFIEILPGKDGLCHISELTEGRVNSVHDVLREGDECMVKVLDVERGKIRLSRRAALADKAND